jgi:hypothetical protein
MIQLRPLLLAATNFALQAILPVLLGEGEISSSTGHVSTRKPKVLNLEISPLQKQTGFWRRYLVVVSVIGLPLGYVGELGPNLLDDGVFNYHVIGDEVVGCTWEILLRPDYGELI